MVVPAVIWLGAAIGAILPAVAVAGPLHFHVSCSRRSRFSFRDAIYIALIDGLRFVCNSLFPNVNFRRELPGHDLERNLVIYRYDLEWNVVSYSKNLNRRTPQKSVVEYLWFWRLGHFKCLSENSNSNSVFRCALIEHFRVGISGSQTTCGPPAGFLFQVKTLSIPRLPRIQKRDRPRFVTLKLTVDTFQHHPWIQNLILCSNMISGLENASSSKINTNYLIFLGGVLLRIGVLNKHTPVFYSQLNSVCY